SASSERKARRSPQVRATSRRSCGGGFLFLASSMLSMTGWVGTRARVRHSAEAGRAAAHAAVARSSSSDRKAMRSSAPPARLLQVDLGGEELLLHVGQLGGQLHDALRRRPHRLVERRLALAALGELLAQLADL